MKAWIPPLATGNPRKVSLPLKFHALSRNAAEVAHTNIVPGYEYIYRNKK